MIQGLFGGADGYYTALCLIAMLWLPSLIKMSPLITIPCVSVMPTTVVRQGINTSLQEAIHFSDSHVSAVHQTISLPSIFKWHDTWQWHDQTHTWYDFHKPLDTHCGIKESFYCWPSSSKVEKDCYQVLQYNAELLEKTTKQLQIYSHISGLLSWISSALNGCIAEQA